LRPLSFIKVLFTAVFFFNIYQSAFSQSGDTIKPLTKVNKEFLVVANIVSTADTLTGIDSATIAQNLKLANKYFAPIGVSFKLCKVDTIFNFQFDTLNVDTVAGNKKDLLSQYWVANRINMFFTYIVQGDPAVDPQGFADVGGITSSSPVGVYLTNSASPLTYAHELGHYFSLRHTFENKGGFELVNKSNCTIAGDSICDTPADPGSGANGSCIFTSTAKDSNGDYYDPDVTNIMSYYSDACKCGFTWGQFDKMAKYYLKNPIEW
jgi:hypothetical protein